MEDKSSVPGTPQFCPPFREEKQMSVKAIVVCLLFALGAVCTAEPNTSLPFGPKSNCDEHSATNGPLRIVLRGALRQLVPGVPLVCRVEVQNISREDQVICLPNIIAGFSYKRLWPADGSRGLQTVEYPFPPASGPPRRESREKDRDFLVLQPGESFGRTIDIDTAALLPRGGRVLVCVMAGYTVLKSEPDEKFGAHLWKGQLFIDVDDVPVVWAREGAFSSLSLLRKRKEGYYSRGAPKTMAEFYAYAEDMFKAMDAVSFLGASQEAVAVPGLLEVLVEDPAPPVRARAAEALVALCAQLDKTRLPDIQVEPVDTNDVKAVNDWLAEHSTRIREWAEKYLKEHPEVTVEHNKWLRDSKEKM